MSDLSQLQIPSMRERVSREEWATRCDLAACYRLVHHFGMDDLVYNHISARVPGEEGHFLINAYGMTYDEITASSLVKIDFEGNVVQDSGTGLGINRAGFVIHTHAPASMAVSSLRNGLLPMTQMAMRFDRVAYHDYQGVALDLQERKSLVEDLGEADVMLLRNHGALAVGRTVGEAFNSLYRLEKACVAQLLAQGANDAIVLPSPDVQEKTRHMYRRGVRRVVGLLEWPAMRRLADRIDPSYKI